MPERIREVRLKYTTTFNTSFTVADDASWNADGSGVIKIRPTVFEMGLGQEALPDESLQSRISGAPAPVPALQTGTVKIGGWFSPGPTSVTTDEVARLVGFVTGGYWQPPLARSDTVESGSNTTTHVVLAQASSYVATGTLVMIGTAGDARGNGEVRRVSACDTGGFDLEMALSGAPNEGDYIYIGHTLYYDQDATQNYLDGLTIGWNAEDQVQFIGGMGPLSISNLAMGQMPQWEIEITPGRWQNVASGDRATLAPSVAPAGTFSYAPDMPARGMGGLFIGDYGVTTRQTMKGGDFSIDPGISFEKIPDPNGVNGIGGWQRVRATPKFECTVLVDDDYGLHADFAAATAKQVILQIGRSSGGTIAFCFPRAFIDEAPTRQGINNLAGLRLKLHGEEPTVAATAVNRYSTPMCIGLFNA